MITFTLFLVLLACWPSATSLPPTWCPQSCGCYNGWSTVDCSGRRLGTLPVLPEPTTRLYLDHNRIEYLLEGSFIATPNLVTLTLQQNQLTLLDTSSFIGLVLLQSLNLSSNQLIVFKAVSGNNTSLPQLRTLDLSYNQLQSVPRNISLFAPNLQVLLLQGNLITSAWLDPSYSSLPVFRHLDLSGNRLRTLGVFHLDALRGGPMQWLGMSGCGLLHIAQNALGGLANLTALSLAYNSLMPGTLAAALQGLGNTSHLLQLDLANMPLRELSYNMVGHLTALEVLDMSNCSLESVQEGSLAGLSHLHTLHLHSNRISFLNDTAYMMSLRRLNLSHNLLSQISLHRGVALEWLDLSHNQLRGLPSHWLSQCDSLRLIDLSHNHLASIHTHAFHRVTLHTLKLDYNQLTVLHSFGMMKLRALHLSHNLLAVIARNTFDQFSDTLEELDVSYNFFQSLPNNHFADFVTLLRLSLSHNQLGRWLSLHPNCSFFSSLGHVQVLNLAHNNISTLPRSLCSRLSHLTSLYLGSNRVHNMADLCLSQLISLAKLDLSSNMLTAVDPSPLWSLTYLETVDLRANPFHCSCDLSSFLHWLNVTHVNIAGLAEGLGYVCHTPTALAGLPILHYTPPPASCRPHHTINQDLTLFGITVAAVVGLTILVTLVAYYCNVCQVLKSLHYRWQIRYRSVSGIEIADPKVWQEAQGEPAPPTSLQGYISPLEIDDQEC